MIKVKNSLRYSIFIKGVGKFNHFFSAEREKSGKKYITKASYLEATSVINTKGKKISSVLLSLPLYFDFLPFQIECR